MENYTIAIDFGSSKIACAVAEQSDQGIKIIAYKEAESEGINKGEIVNIQKVIDVTKSLIDSIASEIESEISNIIVGVSGQYIQTISTTKKRTRKNRMELISQVEVEELTEDAQKQRTKPEETVLLVIAQSYNIDDLIGEIDAIGIPGTEIEGSFKLIIGRAKALENTRVTLNKLNLKPTEYILKSNAVAKAVLNEDETEVGVTLVDIGGGSTDILIIKDNIIRYAAVIPFGGNTITEDIRHAFGISLKNAELLKIQLSSCYSDLIPDNKNISIKGVGGRDNKQISRKALSLVVEARMVEIVEAIEYEIEKSTYKDSLSAGMVITGGGARLLHLPNLIKATLGINLRIAYPDENIAVGSCDEANSHTASVAVGLAIMGINSEKDIANKREGGQKSGNVPVEENINTKPQDKHKEDKTDKPIFKFKNLLDNLFDSNDNEA